MMHLKNQLREVTDVDTGLAQDSRQAIAEELATVLADTYTLYLKTHYYHWNVTGSWFATLHNLFEVQYQDMWQAIDDIAERMRAIGAHAPGTYSAFNKLTNIEEDDDDDLPDAVDMCENLVNGHEILIKTIRRALPTVQDVSDESTADLLIGRLRTHEKMAWMLRSMLD